MLNPGIYQSWDDSHDGTDYPIVDGASRLAVDGATRFPQDVIIDAIIGARAVDAVVYIRTVDVAATSVAITFAQGSVDVATATLAVDAEGWVPMVSRIGVVYAGRVKVAPGSVGSLINLGIGTHNFSQDSTAIVPYAVFLSPRAGVRGIAMPDGEVITGNVTISIGAGLSVTAQPDGSLLIDAVGKPYVGRDEDVLLRRAIRSVDVTATNVDGPPSMVTLTPMRGSIGITTDNPDSTKSPAVVVTADGATVTIEVSS